MKKDLLIAVAVIVAAFALAFGLNAMRAPMPPRASQPFSLEGTAHAARPVTGKVIMRINGNPVTESEYTAAFRGMPEEMQRQFSSPEGKHAFAEQFIRFRLLVDQAEKAGLERDPAVRAQLDGLEAQLAALRTRVLASASLAKLAAVPDERAVQSFYAQHRQEFMNVELEHIVVAYQGSMLQPRKGGAAPTEEQAAQKALELARQIQHGADFAKLAAEYSDDPTSAANGGSLGPYSKGMLPPEIEQQLAQLPPGQVSGPIPSRYGVHIFRIDAPQIQPLERVRPAIVNQLRQQNAEEHADAMRKTAKVEFDPGFFPEAKTWKDAPAPQRPPS